MLQAGMTKKKERPQYATNCEASGLNGALPYRSRRRILTDGEQRFFRQGLSPAIEDKYRVLMKTRLTDVLDVPSELWRDAVGRKVQQRHIDFLLVTPCTGAIVAAIELDDASHLCEKQQAKDAYLGDALLAAGVPLIRFPIYRRYNPKIIRRAIKGVLKRRGRGCLSQLFI